MSPLLRYRLVNAVPGQPHGRRHVGRPERAIRTLGRMMTRLAAVLAWPLSLSLSVALVGCSDNNTIAPRSVAAVPEGPAAGSPLMDRLHVPVGTQLLGGVFPRRSGTAALLLVTGDPVAAFVDLVDQAWHAGFELQAGQAGGDACWLSAASDGRRGLRLGDVLVDDWWDHPGQPLGQLPAPTEIAGLACVVSGWTAPRDGQQRWLDLRLAVSSGDDPYLAHLAVGYSVNLGPRFVRPSSDALRLPVIDSPVQPRALPAVPGVGADLGWPFTARFASNPYRVAVGSRLLAPVFVWGPACGTYGFAVVLKATGTVETVVSEYAAQFAKDGLTEQDRERGSSPGTILHATTAGGGDAHVTAITANNATYLLIDRCED
jgi:hypothetical protein